MIREYKPEDLPEIMKLWLDTNLQAHTFIPEKYWMRNLDTVKEILPSAEVYVYESHGRVEAFIGIQSGYIAGIFVSSSVQSAGIGKQLVDKAKERYSALSLLVYQKNNKAIQFYKREGFIIRKEQLDENTGEMEYFMTWTNNFAIL